MDADKCEMLVAFLPPPLSESSFRSLCNMVQEGEDLYNGSERSVKVYLAKS